MCLVLWRVSFKKKKKKNDETINRKNQKLFVQLEMDDDRELGCDGDTGPKCLVWEMVEPTTTKTP